MYVCMYVCMLRMDGWMDGCITSIILLYSLLDSPPVLIHPSNLLQSTSVIVQDLLTLKEEKDKAVEDDEDVCFVMNAAELTQAVEVGR